MNRNFFQQEKRDITSNCITYEMNASLDSVNI